MNDIIVNDGNIRIKDSWKVWKADIPGIIDGIRKDYPDNGVVKTRWRYSLIMEWVAHNFLYKIDYKRERTADVDLNVMPWYEQLLYCVCGTLVYPFTV